VVDIAEKVREGRLRWCTWTCNKKRGKRAAQRHYGMKREDVR
jgi:hypothetical protein